MFRDVLSHADMTEWPTVGLVIFLIACSLIVVWVFRRGSAAHYKEMGNLVFENRAPHSSESHKEITDDSK